MSLHKTKLFRMRTGATLIVLLLMIAQNVLFAQSRAFSVAVLEQQPRFMQWTLKQSGRERQIRQWSVPIGLNLRIGKRGHLSITGSPALSEYKVVEAQQKFEFSGFSDLKINGSYLVGKSNWLFIFGLNLPFGHESLSNEEFVVANVIAEDAFDFPLSLYGTGYEGNFGIFRAFSLPFLTISGGVSYFMRGGFQFFEADSSSILDLGDEITGTVGISKELTSGNLNLDFYFTHRRIDVFAKQKIFEPGNKLVLSFSTDLKRYPFALRFQLVNRWRYGTEALFLSGISSIPRQDLNENPYQVEIATILQQHLFQSRFKLVYAAELKRFAENDAGSEGALIYGGGVGFQVLLWRGLISGANFKYYKGHLTSLGARYDVSALQINSTFKFSF